MNCVAVAWASLTIVIYVYVLMFEWGIMANITSMPLYLPVRGENIGNMNWAALIVGATFLFSGVWWIFGARFRYLKNVPINTEPVDKSSSS